ncbi:TBC1 domain family member 2A isoform X2 [Sebastes umbrosus]|uniref:TBC1 domain family member 2A isoform X2 n=1 Tax=Sebastes umbrosus TaxID=72105 RepID=UPI00189CD7CB|nr:TBC1 domain family member 2A isoform X2 [Sebastes umbrosus]
MDGSSSTGNPIAASSRWLPACPDEDTLQSADWISASEEDDGQRRESNSLPGSQKDQSPAETHQRPAKNRESPVKTHQSPVETHQIPAETHQIPAETHQSPAKTRQRPAETPQIPAKTHQSPAKSRQRTAKTCHSPAKTHQRPTETQQTAKKHLSPAEKHRSPAEKHQRPAETQQITEKPDHLGLTEHINNKDPPTEKQEPEDSPTGPDPLKPNLPTEQQKLGDSPPDQPSPTQPDPLKPDLLCPDQKKPGDPFCPEREHQTQEGLCLTNQKTEEDPPPPVKDLKVFTSTFKLHFFESRDQQDHQDLHPEKLTSTIPESRQDHQDPPPQLNTKKAPPPHLKTKKAPLPPPPPHLNTKKAPPPPHLKTKKAPLPPPPHLNTKKAPRPPHLNIKQAPPPPHLSDQQDPPPPLPEVLPSIIHTTEVSTQAPLAQARLVEAPTVHTPLVEAPLVEDPLVQAPPVQALPVQAPLVEAPLVLAPPVEAPVVQAPPVQALLVQAPPVEAPPVEAPLVEAPPVQTPPVEAPLVQAPLFQAPPVQAPSVQACPGQAPPVQGPPVEAPLVEAPLVEAPPVQTPPVEAPLVQALPVQPTLFQAPPVQAPPVQAPPLTIEIFSDQVRPLPLVSSSGDPKLCGFLQKQGGPLRAWKQRWFTYEEKKNQLFYYRTPQDVTPLGRVELCSATFTYPLKAENGTFHIKTPERTFILKAVSQELMLYWLQQLQVKRWQHRQTSTCPDPTCPDPTNNNNNNNTADFLPELKSPVGLVGEEAANVPSQWAPLANVSIKHPFIEIQNSVHSLRKRSSQDGSQSVFHVEAPPWIPPNSSSPTSSTTVPPVPRTSTEPPPPPPALSLAEQAGQVTPPEVREVDGRNRKMKSRSSSTMTILRRDSSDRTSRLQQDKQMLMEEVKAQKELVWILHKALEASQLEKRTCAEFVAEKGEQERLELLRHRERQAVDLRGRLEDAMTETEATRTSLAKRDSQLIQLQDHIGMLVEKNNAKQEVIIKLSNQMTSCMSSDGGLNSPTFRRLQQEIENLKDDIEAYKIQNKFLNSEIYQLTQLWRTSSEQEKSLMVKCAYLEASNCQVESRYLGVLRQLQETRSLDPVQQGAVQKMIEDALKGELKSVVKLNMARDHDEYGFKIIPDYEVEDMKLLAKIQALEIRSHNLLHQEGGEHPQLSRWAQYLAGRSADDLGPSPELKGLLRGGVPQEYRQRVWRWVVRTRTRTIRERHSERYQQLCEKSRTCLHPASRQIQLDLHRTLTTNQHFSSPSSPTLPQLRRILLAFSWQNPAIGYCQGLNRLAALALLVLQSEEDAFWCLVAVVETMMPQDYYTKNLVASQADQRVLKDFLAEKLPRLAAHFEDHNIDVSLITFNWFLVVFVESLPSDILLPLWDAFLYEGTKVIFRYALALFKYKEDDILKIHDGVEIYQYLRFFTKTISDGRRLTSIAFNDMNPFPGRLLRNRRVLHLERLQGELRELEEQQKEFVSESAERKDKELDTMVSEDDEEL